jgi:hypothetical protein
VNTDKHERPDWEAVDPTRLDQAHPHQRADAPEDDRPDMSAGDFASDANADEFSEQAAAMDDALDPPGDEFAVEDPTGDLGDALGDETAAG